MRMKSNVQLETPMPVRFELMARNGTPPLPIGVCYCIPEDNLPYPLGNGTD